MRVYHLCGDVVIRKISIYFLKYSNIFKFESIKFIVGAADIYIYIYIYIYTHTHTHLYIYIYIYIYGVY